MLFFFMFSATVNVLSGGLFWLELLCSAVLVELLLLKLCCVHICRILFVMYGSNVFSSVFAITERSEMGLYDVRMSLFSFEIGVRDDVLHVGEIWVSNQFYVLEVPVLW